MDLELRFHRFSFCLIRFVKIKQVLVGKKQLSKFGRKKIRDSALSYGENPQSLSHLGLVRYPDMTAGWTHGQTDRQTDTHTHAHTHLL